MRKKKKEELVEVTPVKLKPIFGLNPPIYLTIVYVSLFLIILFVVGFLPGIITSGKRVTFTSPVAFSTIYVDSTYIGTTPVTTFLEPGKHEITYSYKDVGQVDETIEVSHPLFLTWLIPRTQKERSPYYLDTASLTQYLNYIQKDIISYSAVLEYDNVTHYPPLFQSAISTLLEGDVEDLSLLQSFLKDSLLFITSKEMLDDAKKAVALLDENKVDTTFIAFEIKKIEALFEESGKKSTPLTKITPVNGVVQSTLSLNNLLLVGTTFEKGSFVVGMPVELTYPGVEKKEKEVVVDKFTISNREISEYQYALFIEENNMWAKSNKEALIQEGLVDTSYLQGIYPTTSIPISTPIRNISYHAAVAFSEWVSNKVGKKVMLPSNDELELAMVTYGEEYQKSLYTQSTSFTPVSLFGGVWELTRDEFVPLERYLERTIENKSILEDVIIKGGSYLNEPSLIDRASIGVMKKNQCSATTGFRIVWK